MLFSSDYSAFDLVQQGTWAASWPAGNQITQQISQTIPYTQTFSTRPLVSFERIVGGNYIPFGSPGGFNMMYDRDIYDSVNPDIFLGYANYYFTGTVSVNSGITFQGFYDRVLTSLPKPVFSVRYTIYTYNA